MAEYEIVSLPYEATDPGLPLESQKPWYDEKLGHGFYFPLQVQDGGLKWSAGFDHLHQSIVQILLTPKGSRVMRPWFGSELWKYIDAPINRRTIAAMRAEIYRALKEETRGEVVKIQIYADDNNSSRLFINIIMRLTNEIAVAFKLAYDRDLARWEGLGV